MRRKENLGRFPAGRSNCQIAPGTRHTTDNLPDADAIAATGATSKGASAEVEPGTPTT